MVTVESMRTIENAGNLRAFAVVNVSDRIRISDVKVVHQPEQKAWVAMPSKSYEVDGKRRWASTVEILDEQLKDEIAAAVLTEFAKLEGQNEPRAAGW